VAQDSDPKPRAFESRACDSWPAATPIPGAAKRKRRRRNLLRRARTSLKSHPTRGLPILGVLAPRGLRRGLHLLVDACAPTRAIYLST
jgi:hypothetical protein